MLQFVQPLESRCLLSSVPLGTAEASLRSDVGALIADAKTAKATLLSDVATFRAALKTLNLPNGPLKSKLVSTTASTKTTIQHDISRIINAGMKDGLAVFNDVLHIYFADAGNPVKIARDQIHLAADLKALRAAETPLIAKLTADAGKAETNVGAAVGALGNSSLQTDWTTLSDAIQSSQQTLVTDVNTVLTDLDAMSSAT